MVFTHDWTVKKEGRKPIGTVAGYKVYVRYSQKHGCYFGFIPPTAGLTTQESERLTIAYFADRKEQQAIRVG